MLNDMQYTMQDIMLYTRLHYKLNVRLIIILNTVYSSGRRRC